MQIAKKPHTALTEHRCLSATWNYSATKILQPETQSTNSRSEISGVRQSPDSLPTNFGHLNPSNFRGKKKKKKKKPNRITIEL
jgi:hypothetical protein